MKQRVVSVYPDPSGQSRDCVFVYVRKGSSPDTRLISFQVPSGPLDGIPEDFLARAVLARGFAFDGNSVIAEVTRKTKAAYSEQTTLLEGSKRIGWLSEGDEERSLSAALVDAELLVKHWLEEAGFEVMFK